LSELLQKTTLFFFRNQRTILSLVILSITVHYLPIIFLFFTHNWLFLWFFVARNIFRNTSAFNLRKTSWALLTLMAQFEIKLKIASHNPLFFYVYFEVWSDCFTKSFNFDLTFGLVQLNSISKGNHPKVNITSLDSLHSEAVVPPSIVILAPQWKSLKILVLKSNMELFGKSQITSV